LDKNGLENMTKKKVRLLVEAQRGVDQNALKPKKAFISQCIDDYMEQNDKDGSDSASEEEPPKKKAKKEKPKPAANDPPKKPYLKVITKTGALAPKRLKELQCDLMTASHFLENAPNLEVNVWGNKIEGGARVFTSGNKGWYAGGKIQVPIGGEVLWGQIGINLSIVGSKEWEP